MEYGDNIAQAAHYIQSGKVVAFPTETVYGLGANALNPLAVARIFEIKERPSFDPLIIHIADESDLVRLTSSQDERVSRLAQRFWPGPLTIVLPKSAIVPDIVTSGLPTVGIRLPDNEIARSLIRASGCPIAAPSANKFGNISPTKTAHITKQLTDVDYILEGGKTTVGIESTIITLTEKGFQILRHGIITQEELETILPCDTTEKTEHMVSPGMLKSHYSPQKRLILADDTLLHTIDRSNAGYISFSGEDTEGYKKVIRVSETHDLREYAVNIFEALHTFEEDGEITVIVAEPVPEIGVGKAIMEKLKKAAFRWREQS